MRFLHERGVITGYHAALDLREVGRRLADRGPLNLLVNNVGGMWSRRWLSPDGVEASVALNQLSAEVLTEALSGGLRAGAPSRIVTITSAALTVADATFDAVEPAGPYYGMAATGRAKLAHLAHTLSLSEQLAGSGG